mmetsp:Transcript_99785/g.250157  ORF Transcript_99785/g.250157 Transcript_99785/m.250157 type:complete len:419 (-) Transcript_99785:311-1567(-)
MSGSPKDAGSATGERPAYLDRACFAMFWCPCLHVSFFNQPCMALWKAILACIMAVIKAILACIIGLIKAIRACANCVWRPFVQCARAVASCIKTLCKVIFMVLMLPIKCVLFLLKPICTCIAKCGIVPIKGCVGCMNLEWSCLPCPRRADLCKARQNLYNSMQHAISCLACGVTVECADRSCFLSPCWFIQLAKSFMPRSVTCHFAGRTCRPSLCCAGSMEEGRMGPHEQKQEQKQHQKLRASCCCRCPEDVRHGWPKCSDCPGRLDCLPTCEEAGCKATGPGSCSCATLCGISCSECLTACGWQPQAPGCVFAPSCCEFCGCGCTMPRCCCSLGVKHLCKMPEEERLFWAAGTEKAETTSLPWPALLVSGSKQEKKGEAAGEQVEPLEAETVAVTVGPETVPPDQKIMVGPERTEVE